MEWPHGHALEVLPDNKEYLSLEEVVKLAEKIGGNEHGFRFIQLPYNLAYNEALVLKNQTIGTEKNLNILEVSEIEYRNIYKYSIIPRPVT